jgi:hypothetical protein
MHARGGAGIVIASHCRNRLDQAAHARAVA